MFVKHMADHTTMDYIRNLESRIVELECTQRRMEAVIRHISGSFQVSNSSRGDNSNMYRSSGQRNNYNNYNNNRSYNENRQGRSHENDSHALRFNENE